MFHGRFSWDSVYFEMPVWLRLFYWKTLDKYFKDKEAAQNAAGGGTPLKVAKPNIPRG